MKEEPENEHAARLYNQVVDVENTDWEAGTLPRSCRPRHGHECRDYQGKVGHPRSHLHPGFLVGLCKDVDWPHLRYMGTFLSPSHCRVGV
jgi:hypothetical protein